MPPEDQGSVDQSQVLNADVAEPAAEGEYRVPSLDEAFAVADDDALNATDGEESDDEVDDSADGEPADDESEDESDVPEPDGKVSRSAKARYERQLAEIAAERDRHKADIDVAAAALEAEAARQREIAARVAATLGQAPTDSAESKAGLLREKTQIEQQLRNRELSFADRDDLYQRHGAILEKLDSYERAEQSFSEFAYAADTAVRLVWESAIAADPDLTAMGIKPGDVRNHAQPADVIKHIKATVRASVEAEFKQKVANLESEVRGLRVRRAGSAPEPERGGLPGSYGSRYSFDPKKSASQNIDNAFAEPPARNGAARRA